MKATGETISLEEVVSILMLASMMKCSGEASRYSTMATIIAAEEQPEDADGEPGTLGLRRITQRVREHTFIAKEDEGPVVANQAIIDAYGCGPGILLCLSSLLDFFRIRLSFLQHEVNSLLETARHDLCFGLWPVSRISIELEDLLARAHFERTTV
jgi:hypothetical protein